MHDHGDVSQQELLRQQAVPVSTHWVATADWDRPATSWPATLSLQDHPQRSFWAEAFGDLLTKVF